MEQLENLTYEQYRLIAKDGDVVFFRGSKKDPVQAVIMFFTESPYSHVALTFWVTINGKKRLMVVESQGGTRRRIVSASYYKDSLVDVIRSPIAWEEICDEALSQVGETPYSYFDATYVGIREFVWRRYKIRLPARNHNGEICSEFIARLMQLESTSVSPGALYERLRVLYPSV